MQVRRPLEPLCLAAALVLLLYYVVIACSYAAAPAYLDHVEPTVTVASLLVNEGRPIYTATDDPSRISLLYGPAVYLVNAAFLRWPDADPILASKIGGVFLGLGSVAVLLVAAARRFGARPAILGSALCVLLYLPFRHFSYWNRCDSLLVFASALGCAAVLVRGRWTSAALLGLALSLAVNTKVHAFLYLVPLLPAYVAARGKRPAALAAALALVLTAAPFLVSHSFPLGHYLTWLASATAHRFAPALLGRNVFTALVVLAPLALTARSLRLRAPRVRDALRDPAARTVLALVGCAALVSVVGAKEGAGTHHLLPFAPVVVLLVLQRWAQGTGAGGPHPGFEPTGPRLALAAGWGLIVSLHCVNPQWAVLLHLRDDTGRSMRAELLGIVAAHPGARIAMGATDKAGDPATWFRPLLFETSHDCLFDVPAMMDMGESGIGVPPATVAAVASRSYDVFVLPASGEPFTMRSLYSSNRELFPPDFVAAFRQAYAEAERGRHYSVWVAKRTAADRR
jgi:hypothetical protein